MGDHFALLVNGLITESTLHDALEKRDRLERAMRELDKAPEVDPARDEKDSLPKKLVECRICQDEDFDSCMETPCSCRGSLKYAHRRCVQRWCNEKGNTTCEICYQQFKPDFTAPPPVFLYGRIPSNFRRAYSNPQLTRTISADEHHDTDSYYDESSSRNMRWLAVAIIFIVLLLLRHTLPIIINGPDCCFPLIILVVLRVTGFALLLYIIVLALVGLLHRHHLNDSVSGLGGSSEGAIEAAGLPQERSHVIQVE